MTKHVHLTTGKDGRQSARNQVRRLLIGAIGALLLAGSATAQSDSQKLLLGTWRHEALIIVFDGQEPQHKPIKGESYLAFNVDGTWQLRSDAGSSSGSFKWLGPEVIETVAHEHVYKANIGRPENRQIRVDEKRLSLITVRTKAQVDELRSPDERGKPGPNLESLVSVFSRVPLD